MENMKLNHLTLGQLFSSCPFSFNLAFGSGRSMKRLSICRDGPDNIVMNEPENAHVLECFIPIQSQDLNITEILCSIQHRWRKIEIKAATQPFAEGAQRITFHGKKRSKSNKSVKEENIVLKEFKHFGFGRDRREEYISIMETQYVATLLAAKFNKVAPKACKSIKYLQVSEKSYVLLEMKFRVFYAYESLRRLISFLKFT